MLERLPITKTIYEVSLQLGNHLDKFCQTVRPMCTSFEIKILGRVCSAVFGIEPHCNLVLSTPLETLFMKGLGCLLGMSVLTRLD